MGCALKSVFFKDIAAKSSLADKAANASDANEASLAEKQIESVFLVKM